jgi:Predicted membrane protein
MDIFQNNYIRIVFSSVAVYFFIIVAIRLFGKKELAQLSVYDLVFILLISNAVQNAMVGPDSTLTGGLVAAASLFVVNYILKKMQFRFPKFGRAIQGEAIMLVFEGKILSSNMKNAGITEDELMEVIREHGVATVSEVDLAVLEVDGNISVLSTDIRKKTTRRRKAHKIISKQQ